MTDTGWTCEMKIISLVILLLLTGCSKTPEPVAEQTTSGYVRSVQQFGATYYADAYSSIVFEEDGGRIIALPYVCQSVPPVWTGLRARIRYSWSSCHSGRANSGWWIIEVERVP
jgi:hypothetical protein